MCHSLPKLTYAHDALDSEASEPALRIAASLARDNRAKLTILHVSQTEDCPVGELFDEEPRPPRDEVEKLEELASRVDNVDCACRWVHCEGSHEADVITDEAVRENADMIVIGTHGRTGWSHLVMGGVAEDQMAGLGSSRQVKRRKEPFHEPRTCHHQ